MSVTHGAVLVILVAVAGLFLWGLGHASEMEEAQGCAFFLQVLLAVLVVAMLGGVLLQIFQSLYHGRLETASHGDVFRVCLPPDRDRWLVLGHLPSGLAPDVMETGT